jgi:hypothetical protein
MGSRTSLDLPLKTMVATKQYIASEFIHSLYRLHQDGSRDQFHAAGLGAARNTWRTL